MTELTRRPFPSSSASSTNLGINLSNLPPLALPTPASNTLLFTNLYDSSVFQPDTLRAIHSIISTMAPVHAFAPLKSLCRIVISFFDVDAAVAVQQAWDGEAVLGERIRVYFGQWTPVQAKDERLAVPKAGKLLFISPQSPPYGSDMRLDACGSNMRLEDEPNKMVRAEHLAKTLSDLNQRLDGPKPGESGSLPGGRPRRRSSVVIYSPVDDGRSPDLPTVLLEDTGETIESPRPDGLAAY